MFEKDAEGYYYKTYPVTLNIGEEERKNEVTDIFIKGAELGYNKVNDQLTKAKELLKDITSSYGSTEVSEAQLYLKIKKAEIFLKDSEVEK